MLLRVRAREDVGGQHHRSLRGGVVYCVYRTLRQEEVRSVVLRSRRALLFCQICNETDAVRGTSSLLFWCDGSRVASPRPARSCERDVRATTPKKARVRGVCAPGLKLHGEVQRSPLPQNFKTKNEQVPLLASLIELLARFARERSAPRLSFAREENRQTVRLSRRDDRATRITTANRLVPHV